MAIENMETFNEEFDSIVRVSDNYVSLDYGNNPYQLAYNPYSGYNPHTIPSYQIQPKQTNAVEIIMTENNYNRLVKLVDESVTERKMRECDPRLMELYMAYKTLVELLK